MENEELIDFSEDDIETGKALFGLLEAMHEMAGKGAVENIDLLVRNLSLDQLQGALIVAANCIDIEELRRGRSLVFGDDGGQQ